MINIALTFKEDTTVGIYKTMSIGQTYSIAIESEDYVVDIAGTRSEILKFIDELQKSIEDM